MRTYAVRFSKKQRIEHFVVMTTFVLLALTGSRRSSTRWARRVSS